MRQLKLKRINKNGFTIIELIVVISVIAILASISILGYGAWRNSVTTTQVKNDLNAIASAMENSRTFNNQYPITQAAVNALFTPSTNVTLTLSLDSTITAYCIDGVSTDSPTSTFYIASETKDQGPLAGTCATRPGLTVPSVPSGVIVASVGGTQVSLSWTAATGAITYTVQCASDAAFIVGLRSVSVAAPTISGTVTGLTPSSSFYCRVNAANGTGTSGWSSVVSTTTDYPYGSLATATSIEGYWTSPPQGFLLEDGSAISRTTYSDLFAVIGTTYGVGDGSTTFNLPDSRGRTAVNRNLSETEFDSMGEKPGSKTEALTIAQIPSHTHQVPFISSGDPSDYLGGSGAAYGMSASWAARQGSYDMIEPVGGSGTHNNIQPSIVKTSVIKFLLPTGSSSTLSAATSIQGYWTSAPSGYLLEDGSAVSRTTYADLFAVMGTTYGSGNGSTTFNLPDSRGRTAVNRNLSETEFDSMGEKPGSKTEALTIAQIPSHTHQVPFISSGDPSDYLGGSGAAYGMSASWAARQGSYDMIEPVGGSGTHNNIQPSIVKTFAVKYTPSVADLETVPAATSIQGYWTSAPSGYLLEDGSAVSRTTYADLFAVMGTTYGSGNGSTTFNLPDSRGRTAVNRNTSDSEFDSMGEKPGSKTETLTIAQIPSHANLMPYISSGDPSDYLGGSGAAYGLSASWAARQGSYDMLEPVGGGGTHNEIQPSIVKMFAIKY